MLGRRTPPEETAMMRCLFVAALAALALGVAPGRAAESDPIVAEAVRNKAFVFAEFVSASCPVCDEMRPVVESTLARHPEVGHQRHDADLEVDLSKKYRVRCVPVYVIVDPDGRETFNEVGTFTEAELDEILHRGGVAPH